MIFIKAISIENFKSFGPRQKLPIKSGGVNFLFGPNSQGKSSCLLALGIIHEALMKQNFNLDHISHADNSPDTIISDDLVNYNRLEEPFCLSYEMEFSIPDNSLYNIEVNFYLNKLKDTQLQKFEFYEIIEGEKEIVFKLSGETLTVNYDSVIFKASIGNYLQFDSEINDLSGVHEFNQAFRIPGSIFLSKWLEDADNQIEPGITNLKFSDVIGIDQINNFIRTWFSPELNYKFDWIGANRYNPQKNYFIEGEKGILDKKFLERKHVDELNNFLKTSDLINIDYEFVLNKQAKEGSFIEKTIYKWGIKSDHNETKTLKLSEVGSGIAHIFQILLPLNSVNLNKYGNIQIYDNERVVIIQQPEIHLHPSLQVQLAKACFELSKKHNITLIIETHSEHFIKAAQLEVAKGLNQEKPILSKDDLSVLYVAKDGDGFSKVKQMQLDETGAFTEPWPDDFFELSADLSLERLRQSYKSRN